MTEKEIFNLLANGIIDALPRGLDFREGILNIMRLEGVVEFNSYVLSKSGQKRDLEIHMGHKYAKAVFELYQITQTQLPKHINWNRAKYRNVPTAKWHVELEDKKNVYYGVPALRTEAKTTFVPKYEITAMLERKRPDFISAITKRHIDLQKPSRG